MINLGINRRYTPMFTCTAVREYRLPKDESIHPSNPFDEIASRAGLDQLAGSIRPPGHMFDTPDL